MTRAILLLLLTGFTAFQGFAQYTGGDASVLSSKALIVTSSCVTFASSDIYSGGTEGGFTSASVISTPVCQNFNFTSDIYKGGTGQGLAVSGYSPVVNCSSFNLMSDIYKGGAGQGLAISGFYPTVNCATFNLASDIYKGGVEDGAAVSEIIKNINCGAVVAGSPYNGGDGQGFASSAFFAPVSCNSWDVVSTIYKGGIEDGFSSASLISYPACPSFIVLSDIYKGGVQDGVSASTVISTSLCPLFNIVSDIYKGGEGHGSYAASLPMHLVPGVTIDASTLSICAGETIIFTAFPVAGGLLPEFEWFVNGVSIGVSPGDSIQLNNLVDGDEINVELTSSLACASPTVAMSSALTVSVITVAIKIWNGSVSDDWHNPLNWNCGIPTTSDIVFIPASPSNQPMIFGGNTGYCQNIELEGGASLTIQSSGVLNVNQ
ncbi:MAG: hypothetical protein EA412_03560 [Chitinophagaceae bacterium]|nr:MAG: hypothetical protein EA412_03560 [Chitinophagaceae bacterium]